MTHVVIIAGGCGKRLWPLTKDVPKPMLPLNGKPMLEWIVKRFVDQGFKNITISIGYLGTVIQSYFGSGERFNCNISYVNEFTPLGTAGALRLLPTYTEPFIVTNADVLMSVDYNAMVRYHHSYEATATLGASTHRVEIPYGVLEEEGCYLKAIHEKPSYEYPVGAGVYVFSPEALNVMSRYELWDAIGGDEKPIDMPDFLQLLMENQHKIAVFPITGHWLDIGRHDHLRQARILHG